MKTSAPTCLAGVSCCGLGARLLGKEAPPRLPKCVHTIGILDRTLLSVRRKNTVTRTTVFFWASLLDSSFIASYQPRWGKFFFLSLARSLVGIPQKVPCTYIRYRTSAPSSETNLSRDTMILAHTCTSPDRQLSGV